MSKIVVLTRIVEGQRIPGLRLHFVQVVGYYATKGGTHVITTGMGEDWWTVAETPEEIDRLVMTPTPIAGLFPDDGHP